MKPRACPQQPASQHAPLSDCGVYCLGSDGMLDWMIGLLESLKTHAPHCRLYIIPFDDNVAKLSALQSRYRFEFYQSEMLPILEEAAQAALGKSAHAARVFRKLSVF